MQASTSRLPKHFRVNSWTLLRSALLTNGMILKSLVLEKSKASQRPVTHLKEPKVRSRLLTTSPPSKLNPLPARPLLALYLKRTCPSPLLSSPGRLALDLIVTKRKE